MITKTVTFEKGYDCSGPAGCAFGKPNCAPGKGGYHGMHGANMRFVLKGAFGAVQFVVYTNWYAKDTAERVEQNFNTRPTYGTAGQLARLLYGPMPADLGYHALDVSDSQKEWMMARENCELLDGRPCYYDGSGLNAEPVFEILVTQGSDAVWVYLEEYYLDTFIRS